MNDSPKYLAMMSKTPIFWNINSVDKPSKELFNKMIQWEILPFTPNWVDQFTVTIITDSPEYTILQLVETVENGKDVQYFFTSAKILKKLKKSYLMQFDLDIFLTYYYDLEDYLNKNDVLLKINRTNQQTYFSQNWPYFINKKDSVLALEQYPLTNVYSYNANLKITINSVDIFRLMTNVGFPIGKSKTLNPSGNLNTILYCGNNTAQKIRCWVFQTPDGNYFALVAPCENGWITLQNSAISAEGGDFNLPKDGDGNIRIISDTSLFNLSKVSYFATKFVGIFDLPFFDYINKNWFIWKNGAYSEDGSYNGNAINLDDNASFLGFSIARSAVMSLGDWEAVDQQKIWNILINNYDDDKSKYEWMGLNRYQDKGNNILKASTDTSLGVYLCCKIFCRNFDFSVGSYNNTPNNVNNWMQNGNISFDGYKFNFIPDINYSNIKYINVLVNSWVGTYNVATDSYNNYIQSTMNTQNTGIAIAKQQTLKNGIVGGLNTGLNFAKNLLTFNPIGAIQSLVSGADNAASTILKYQNTIKETDAKNLDARNSSHANNISSSVGTDDAENKINIRYNTSTNNFRQTFLINFPRDPNNIANINKYLFKYGFYIDRFSSSKNLFNKNFVENYGIINNVVYWDYEIVDSDVLKLWKPNINEDLFNAIQILINNSFRIWNVEKNLNETIKYDIGTW